MNTQTESIKYGKITWANIVHPDEKTMQSLKKKYGFHELDLEDCLSGVQRSKIDDYEDYLFIVIHYPYYDKRKKRILHGEIDIFIGQNYVITINNGRAKALNKLMDDSKKEKHKKENMSKGTGYLLYVIIRELFDDTFPMVDDIEKSMTGLEHDLFDGDAEKDMVRDILWLKKDIITFRRIISPQRAVIAQLEHKNKKFLPENLEVYFDDVVDKIEKIWGNLENLKELAEDLQDTNEVLISHQTNRVIKILTVFSVILLPLTLITGFYGMNIDLPYANLSNAVLGIGVSMFVLALFMLVFFKYKRWL
jgi:magnesium transporter